MENNISYVDIETECLTLKGWKKFSELLTDDYILSYDEEKNFLIWDKFKNVNTHHYKGEVIYIESRRISIIYTPDHKSVIESNNKIKIIKAKDLNHKHNILTACKNNNNSESIDEDLAYLLGIIITDGHIHKYGIGITQNYIKNDDVVDKIFNCLNRLGIKYTFSKRVRYFRYNSNKKNKDTLQRLKKCEINNYNDVKISDIIDIRISNKHRDIFLKWIPYKKITYDMFKLDNNSLRKIVEGIIDGDGGIRSSKSFTIRGKYEEFHDLAQIISFLAGFTADRIFSNHYANYTQLTNSTHKLLRNAKNSIIEKKDYDAMMWCPIMEKYENWIARRNGKIFITSN